ncbi:MULTISPECIES: ABC transporter substrate-binding protein [Kribbella]|uniref:Raffinose/stachyose/melibiose transport system substrate-binding protein n=1 Tax=Kribbella pratensis TaxID=2512112 RepID=A0ABY2FFK3_9ACTN|nr:MULTISPECIES: extracellular solute-binding protein [Kribbella]TDW90024.1 raffinose/stachyose/melibiose transport system substrate-binding protein [Kribbella pratensis]TDW97748.1 carbohydrate ABC transporter substrate-binding protein (CUT1 family) [Kribbella sp. VKM Ac-2566]
MSTFSRRGFLGLTSAAALGAGLSACTGGGTSTSSGGATGAASNDLRVFTYEGDETIGLFKAQLKKFDQQAGTTTTVESLPGSGAAVYPDKLRTQLLGGKGPDIWRIWGGQIGSPFAKAKQVLDLAPYYQKYGWDSSINKQAIEGMTFEGMKAGLPLLSLGLGAWYNKSLFAKAGVSAPPKSYAELEEVNDKLVAVGVTPCGLGGKYGWDIMRLFEYLLEHTAGPELHDKLLTGDESWDRPEVVEAFTLFKKWQDKKWLPQGALGLDPSDVEPWYVQGKTAYTIVGPWTEAAAILSAKKSPSGFGNFELPTDKTPARHSGFVEGYMINAKASNPDKAAELLDFLAKPETQKALQITASTVKGAEPDPKSLPLSAEWAQKYGSNPFYTIQDQAFPKKQADQYFSVQSDLLQGSVKPDAAAKKMQEIVSAWAKS